MMPAPGDVQFVRCPYADEHPRIEQQLVTLEREMGEVRGKQTEYEKEWRDFLGDFGELKATVEGLRGRMAGYVLAGSVLAGGLATLAQYVFRR